MRTCCRSPFTGALALLVLSACGAAPEADAPYVPPPASEVVEGGPVPIRREVFLVDGARADKNPLSGAETPAEYNRLRVVRYRVDESPPRPARAIVVLMPGLLGGAGSFDALARALVRRSSGAGAVEAWAIDRRANLLEDHRGLDVAEARKDPELGRRYYFEGAEAAGARFGGFRSAQDASFAAEWGLRVTVEDLRAVIGQVPQAERRGRVVLLGHSLGASIVEQYAAWDFGGTPGYGELAALVLVEGGARVEGQQELPLSQADYEEGGVTTGPFPQPGLGEIRRKAPFFALPLVGVELYPTTGVAAMRSFLSPGEIVDDPDRAAALRTLLSLPVLPRMTNRAAMGLAFGRQYIPLAIAAITCGVVSGGPVMTYQSPLGATVFHPTDPGATYDWVEFDRTEPPGLTSLADFSRSWFQGPGVDFAEWYFPTRLLLDVAAASTLTMGEGDWPVLQQGLRAIHGAGMDLPLLAMVAAPVSPGDTSRFQALRELLDPVPIGAGRPQAGTPRSSAEAFQVVGYGQMTHIDPLAGADVAGSQPRQWYDALARFALSHTEEGGVVVPARTDGAR